MDKERYIALHHSADKLALEAARQSNIGSEADCYIENYQKVIEYLISEYKKHDPQP